MTVGAKRNMAIRMSTGDLIAFWDDDDYYDVDRLKKQASYFKDPNEFKFVLFKECLYYDMNTKRLFELPKYKQKQIWTFKDGVIVTAMMFTKSVFNNSVRFENRNLGEDQLFIEKALYKLPGVVVKSIDNPMLFVYFKHNNNTYNFDLFKQK
jgi:glycosyltransferase involved in cell wall biosynthesis